MYLDFVGAHAYLRAWVRFSENCQPTPPDPPTLFPAFATDFNPDNPQSPLTAVFIGGLTAFPTDEEMANKTFSRKWSHGSRFDVEQIGRSKANGGPGFLMETSQSPGPIKTRTRHIWGNCPCTTAVFSFSPTAIEDPTCSLGHVPPWMCGGGKD